jgi:hypothetical protein
MRRPMNQHELRTKVPTPSAHSCRIAKIACANDSFEVAEFGLSVHSDRAANSDSPGRRQDTLPTGNRRRSPIKGSPARQPSLAGCLKLEVPHPISSEWRSERYSTRCGCLLLMHVAQK